MKMKSLTEFHDWWSSYLPFIYLSEHPPRTVFGRLFAGAICIPWMVGWTVIYGFGGLPFVLREVFQWVRRG